MRQKRVRIQRVDWRSLRVRLLAGLGGLLVVLGGLWVWRGFEADSEALARRTQARLEGLAAAAGLALDGDRVGALRDGQASPADAAAIRAALGALAERAALEGQISALVPLRTTLARIEARPDDAQADALAMAACSDDAAAGRATVDWIGAMGPALFEGRSSSRGPLPDPSGRGGAVLSAFGPLQDSFGGTVGIVRVDVPWSSSVWTALLWALGRVLLVALGTAGVLLAGDRVVRRALAPLARLERRAEALAAGELDEPVVAAKGAGASEIAGLERALESLRGGIAARLEEERVTNGRLLESKRTLEGNLAARAEVLAGLGRELHEPLSRFGQGLRALESRACDPATKQAIAGALQAGWALARSVEHALQLASLEGGAARRPEERFDLAELVERVVGPARLRAAERELALRVIVPETLPSELLGDPGALGEVLGELVDNALEATREGSVTVRVWPTAAREGVVQLRFEVADTGRGLGAEERSRAERALRERLDFVRVERGGWRGRAGHGLARASELVQRLGGELAFESREGAGSRFWFFACFQPPVAAGAAGAGEPVSAPAAALPAQRAAAAGAPAARLRIQGAS